jgi:hypothetical protein
VDAVDGAAGTAEAGARDSMRRTDIAVLLELGEGVIEIGG